MYKKSIFLFLSFMISKPIFAQLFCEIEPAANGNPAKTNAFVDAIIIWIAVAIVLVTLYLSIKFLVKPDENDPKHIKNITKDEGF
ncbi:MAG: hypothetical protein ACTIKA_09765 [Psychroflexus halocasei]